MRLGLELSQKKVIAPMAHLELPDKSAAIVPGGLTGRLVVDFWIAHLCGVRPFAARHRAILPSRTRLRQPDRLFYAYPLAGAGSGERLARLSANPSLIRVLRCRWFSDRDRRR